MKKITLLLFCVIFTTSYAQHFETDFQETTGRKNQGEPSDIEFYQAEQSNNLNLKTEQSEVELRIDSIIGIGYGNNTYSNSFYEYDNNYIGITSYLMARPDLNDILYAENNTITVNMLYYDGETNFKLELSRDNFNTIDFETIIDATYYQITQDANGDELLWNTVYQVRVTPVDATEPDLLGSVETIFPTILKEPSAWDVTDVAAKVNWESTGQTITSIKAFAATDLRLTVPLVEASVTEGEFLSGSAFIEGLEPETNYQIAIYSGSQIRGWTNYKTLAEEPDYSSIPNLIDLREDTSPGAFASALTSTPDGATILLARGSEYSLETNLALSNSVTIRAAYGFGEKRAKIIFPYNFDLSEGAEIDHIRFIDLELRGSDWGGKYVVNISNSGTLNELSIDNCFVTNFRGIGRIKTPGVTINNYNINNTVVDSINGYGVFTVDHTESILKNFKFTNSTFNHLISFLVSRNNSESILIDHCTLANLSESGRQLFRWRGGEGLDNIANGVTISNSIIGHSWERSGFGVPLTIGRQGLDNTTFSISNTFTVSDFSWSHIGEPIDALPIGNAGSTQAELWVDADNFNFNFADLTFVGKNSSGDPRWYNNDDIPIEKYYNWEATSNAYIKERPSRKEENFFDDNNNRTHSIYYHWDSASSSFIPDRKYEYSYDVNGNETLESYYIWDSALSSFIPDRKYEYSYDENGNRTLNALYIWDSDSSSFVPIRKYVYVFDTNSNRTLEAYYTWDIASSTFIPKYRYEYTYDTNDNLTLELYRTWDISSSSSPDYRREYSYDSDGSRTLDFTYFWDSATASFNLKYKSEYSYETNNNSTITLLYNWDAATSSFLPNSKSILDRDADGSETLRSYSIWDSTTELFIETRRTEQNYVITPYRKYRSLRVGYEFDTQAGILKPTTKFEKMVVLDNDTNYTSLRNDFEYDTNSSDWTKIGQVYHHYSKISTLSIHKPEEKTVSVYPNPTANYLNIKSTKMFSNANFTLYDVNGRQVLSKQLKASTQIDVQHLTPALYFYRITDGKAINENGIIVKK